VRSPPGSPWPRAATSSTSPRARGAGAGSAAAAHPAGSCAPLT
jgi:hypothetical protein